MIIGLADRLPRGPGAAGIRVWLKSSGYARRLLLGEAGDPWTSAASYLAFFTQAHGLLRPDVALIEVWDLLASWAGRHPELIAEMAAKRRLSYPLRKLLETEEARRLLGEILDAVAVSLRGRCPVVLSLPTPRAALALGNALVGRDGPDIDGDSVEDAAMYMADFLRSAANAPVGGVLLDDGLQPTAPGDIERCRPVLNVARHYRWGVAWRTHADSATAEAIATAVDAIIGADLSATSGKPMGVDLGTAPWSGAAVPPLAPDQFYFAEIPPDQQPEQVLETLTRLRN